MMINAKFPYVIVKISDIYFLYEGRNMIKKMLSETLRPSTLKDVFGQEHITSKNMIIDRAIRTQNIPNMVFYGPPGVGKTTVAKIIADNCNTDIHMFNATHTKTEEIKKIISSYVNDIRRVKPVIYIDELQNFNKKQQQILLEYIENGVITFIAATTENPYQYVYKALLSRLIILEFKEVSYEKIEQNILHCIEKLKNNFKKIDISQNAIKLISSYANGDVRRSINLLELIIDLYSGDDELIIDENILKSLNISKQLSYDINSDNYYDLLSAFQKSIRGSDENAALHYLSRAIKAGDIKPICRRLLVIASEDIGLAHPSAISIVKNCVDSALFMGLPEARIPLAQAVILLATSPKSNSVILAVDEALSDIDNKSTGDIPKHLKDAHYSGAKKLGRGIEYKYPHNYENNYVEQQYLPNELKDRVYYKPQNNKYESQIEMYRRKIKNS